MLAAVTSAPGFGDLRVTRRLGSGTHSVVFEGFDATTGKFVAVKGARKQKYAPVVRREIANLKKLSHTNIIHHICSLLTPDNELLNVVELIDGGDLCQVITSQQGLDEFQARRIGENVCSALIYLHNLELVHSDIKPENILLTRSGVAKLCDFEMLSHQGVVPDFSRGTRAYAAPELVAHKGLAMADTAQDMFSFGVLLFVMLHACFPWTVASLEDAKYKQYVDGDHAACWPWKFFAPALRQLVTGCLRHEPEDRCTAAAAAKMLASGAPWFTQLN